MNQYMTGLLFGYLDRDFEEMDQLYTSLGIIHLFALSGMQVGFFINGIRKVLLRLGILQETSRYFDGSNLFGLCWLVQVFLFSGSQSLAEDPLSKGHPRDGEYGDDLDALNVSHAQVSPDSWRGFELCLRLYFDLGRYQFLFRNEKATSGKFMD